MLQTNGATSQPQVDCVDPPASGSGSQHQVNGANLSAGSPVNFQDSATISFSNPSAGNVQAAVKDASISATKLSVSGPSTAQLSGIGDNNVAAAALSANRVSGTAVVQARAVNTTSPLSGGGDLSADRSLSCPTCEVTSNKGAASGYAALNASSKVVQDPASAQTTAAASKIPLADGAGKIADGWLSANVSLLGSSIDDGELANAYSGVGGCTNQFARTLSRNAAPTCASVAGSDFANQSANTVLAGPSSGGASAPAFRGLLSADMPSNVLKSDATNALTSAGKIDASAASASDGWKVPVAAGAAPNANGGVAFDSTKRAYVAYSGSSSDAKPFPRVLFVGNCTTSSNCSTEASTGNQVTDDTAGTTETAFAMSYTIPASLLTANKLLRVQAAVECDAGASPPSPRVRLRLGSASGTLLYEQSFNSGGCNASAKTGYGYTWLIQGTAAAGASVAVETQIIGSYQGGNYTNGIAQPVNVNTSASQAITITVQWSANAANTHRMRLRQLLVEELN
jgi:hypothetical protein